MTFTVEHVDVAQTRQRFVAGSHPDGQSLPDGTMMPFWHMTSALPGQVVVPGAHCRHVLPMHCKLELQSVDARHGWPSVHGGVAQAVPASLELSIAPFPALSDTV